MTTNPTISTFTARGGWWVVAQVLMFVAAYVVPDRFGRSAPWAAPDATAAVGYALLFAGVLLSLAAAWLLGSGLTPFPRPTEASVLRTGGAYAVVRHPIYTGVLLMALGWSLTHHSIAGLGFDVLLFIFFDRKSAREERWLVERFPDYVVYRKRVRKLIPWIY